MPLLQPMVDLVLGLALRFIIWAVVAGAKLAARLLWSAISEYPGFTFIGVLTARDAGWITSPWLPFVLAALGTLSMARFFTHHPPAEIAQQVRREARKAVATGAAITETGRRARRWVHRRRPDTIDDLPMPPRPVATERATDWKGDPLDDSGRRLFAYREAGWTGGLDHDGHPVDEHGTRITATDAAGERIVADVDTRPAPPVIAMGPVQEVDA